MTYVLGDGVIYLRPHLLRFDRSHCFDQAKRFATSCKAAVQKDSVVAPQSVTGGNAYCRLSASAAAAGVPHGDGTNGATRSLEILDMILE